MVTLVIGKELSHGLAGAGAAWRGAFVSRFARLLPAACARFEIHINHSGRVAHRGLQRLSTAYPTA